MNLLYLIGLGSFGLVIVKVKLVLNEIKIWVRLFLNCIGLEYMILLVVVIFVWEFFLFKISLGGLVVLMIVVLFKRMMLLWIVVREELKLVKFYFVSCFLVSVVRIVSSSSNKWIIFNLYGFDIFWLCYNVLSE